MQKSRTAGGVAAAEGDSPVRGSSRRVPVARHPAGPRYGAGMAKRPRVTVLGSLNMDISVTVPRLPGPGATVLGSAAVFTPGGKGANQAVAAARLGAEVRMVGCVGDDDFGRQLLAALRAEGIDDRDVRNVPGVPTGLAMISVDAEGENIITVAPGANHEVGAQDVTQALAGPHDVLVISAEIPVPAIRWALAQARGTQAREAQAHEAQSRGTQAHGTRCVLNLAPAPDGAADIVSGGVDWLVVNESEAAAVLGRPVDGLPEAGRAAAGLVAAGARHAVVTAGAHGAALATADDAAGHVTAAPDDAAGHVTATADDAAGHVTATPDDAAGGVTAIPAFPITAVDTVGAGDTFVGALAVALAAGVPAAEAVRAAAAAGATAATRHGAQAGMPRPADILAVTGLTWPVA
jgi:ribokinase